jgi:hypothetical protein
VSCLPVLVLGMGVRPGTPDTQRRFSSPCGCPARGRGGWRPGNDQAMLAVPPGKGPAGTQHERSLYSARVRYEHGSGRALQRRRGHGRASVVSRTRSSRASAGQKEAFGCLHGGCQSRRIRPASVTPLASVRWAARLERGSWHARASGQSEPAHQRSPCISMVIDMIFCIEGGGNGTALITGHLGWTDTSDPGICPWP